MSDIFFPLFLAASLALVAVFVLYRGERRRADSLAEQLKAERAKRRPTTSGRATMKAVLETAARFREQGVGGALMSSIEELAGWAEVEQPDLRRIAARDGTVTIFFSDIEDSTSLNEQLGDRPWLKVLGAHDKIVRRSVDRHEGHIVKSQGDGFMVAYSSPAEAVRSAIDIQQQLTVGNRKLRATPIQVRIGIHAGEAVEKDGDLFGRNVALAARVAAQAGGGEILVTEEVSTGAADDDAEFSFTDPREVELKGLPGSYRLMAVEWES